MTGKTGTNKGKERKSLMERRHRENMVRSFQRRILTSKKRLFLKYIIKYILPYLIVKGNVNYILFQVKLYRNTRLTFIKTPFAVILGIYHNRVAMCVHQNICLSFH